MENLAIFFFLAMGGVILEEIFLKPVKSHHFTFSRYIFFLISPTIAALFIATQTTMPLIPVFLIFSVVGTFFEWFIGLAYYKIVGARLWTYHRYSIGKHTSFLSMPIWGFGGVLFWLLTKAFR